MARPDPRLSCARALALIEAYLDGDLPGRRQARLRTHVGSCFRCREALADATRVRGGLRALAPKTMPEAAVAALQARLEEAAAGAAGRVPGIRRTRDGASPIGGREPQARGSFEPAAFGARLRGWMSGMRVWRPALAGAGVVAIVLALMVMARPRPKQPSAEDLARAEAQIRWVMAHLGEIGQRTGGTVRNEVLEARVAKPTAEAVEAALHGESPQ